MGEVRHNHVLPRLIADEAVGIYRSFFVKRQTSNDCRLSVLAVGAQLLISYPPHIPIYKIRAGHQQSGIPRVYGLLDVNSKYSYSAVARGEGTLYTRAASSLSYS